jgi:hypothetical protein
VPELDQELGSRPQRIATCRHVRAEDLVRRFDEIRRDEQLDAAAAGC